MILETWNNLKQKLMTTLQEVKTTSGLHQLFTNLDHFTKQAQKKKREIHKITGNSRLLGELDWEDKEKVEQFNEEIERLYKDQIIPIKEKIAALNPLWGKQEITNLEMELLTLRQDLLWVKSNEWVREQLTDIARLNNLQAGFDSQYQQMETKYLQVEKKLDKVKDLVANQQLEKLKRMIKRGEI